VAITNANLYDRMIKDAREFHKRMYNKNHLNRGYVYLKETDTGEMIIYCDKYHAEKIDKAITKLFANEEL